MRTQSVEGYYPLISKSPHPITRIPPFLKVSHLLTLLAIWSSHVFRINKNATVKLGSVNAICVKQQHNIGFFIFKSTLKYMLGNVYINEINAIYIYIYIYIYYHENNVPFRFSPQWLCSNPCTWAHDAHEMLQIHCGDN